MLGELMAPEVSIGSAGGNPVLVHESKQVEFTEWGEESADAWTCVRGNTCAVGSACSGIWRGRWVILATTILLVRYI